MTSPDLPRPLADLRVLDFSRVVAGPFAGRLLSDLGADVVKVEPPEGDVVRLWGRRTAGLSGFYTQQNAGKRNVSIDLTTEAGCKIARRLAETADIVIENFRPGVMARFGLDHATLAAHNPRVVMLSISGFGQSGPEVGRRAYAPVVHAESGLMARQAEFDGVPPSDPMFSFADSYASLHGLVGVLSAIHLRERTGEGQHLDIAMLHSMMATDDYMHHTMDDSDVVRLGGTAYEAVGGPILLAGEARYLWHQLSKHAGVTDPTPDGASFDEKVRHRAQAIADWVASFTDRNRLTGELDRLTIAFGDVRSGAAVLDSPTLAERDAIVHIDDRAGGTRQMIDSPYRFNAATAGVSGPAPHRGEHNAEVLSEWLGVGESEISGLVASGALVHEEPAS